MHGALMLLRIEASQTSFLFPQFNSSFGIFILAFYFHCNAICCSVCISYPLFETHVLQNVPIILLFRNTVPSIAYFFKIFSPTLGLLFHRRAVESPLQVFLVYSICVPFDMCTQPGLYFSRCSHSPRLATVSCD